MASVELRVGGRRYELACRDGEEEHLAQLAQLVDAKATEAGRALGTTNEARQLLLAALLLADDLAEAPRPNGRESTDGLAEALETLATRVETLADTLEKAPGDA